MAGDSYLLFYYVLPIVILILLIVGFFIKTPSIKRLLRIIFSPFATQKYKFLEKKIFHRLIKVLYALLILFSIRFFFSRITNPQVNNYQDCYELAFDLPIDGQEAGIKNCRDWYTITPGANWAYALLITLILNYIAQLLYYRLVMYIIYGDIKNIK